MGQQSPPDPDNEVQGWLKTLGIESLCQWDVLVFLYRHQTSLVGADYLARLIGYATDPVVVALDALESQGFVERSRVSQGARLYQFTMPPIPPRGKAFERLLGLASDRSGRLHLTRQLKLVERALRADRHAARRHLGNVPSSGRAAGTRSRPRKHDRGKPWLKVI